MHSSQMRSPTSKLALLSNVRGAPFIQLQFIAVRHRSIHEFAIASISSLISLSYSFRHLVFRGTSPQTVQKQSHLYLHLACNKIRYIVKLPLYVIHTFWNEIRKPPLVLNYSSRCYWSYPIFCHTTLFEQFMYIYTKMFGLIFIIRFV